MKGLRTGRGLPGESTRKLYAQRRWRDDLNRQMLV